jgi:alpha-mannosidase
VVSSTAAVGCIEAAGEITGAAGSTLATYSLRYSVARGSRVITVDGELTPQEELRRDPWQSYFAARVAVVTESAIYRLLLRDKLHRARSRRLVAPLGVVIDEAERQTLIGAGGRAFHRCVGDRFLDTLLWVPGETNHKFTLSYGFDVPAPVAVARALIAPPIQLPIRAAAKAAEIGWIIHTGPKEIVVSDFQVGRRKDGKLAAIIRVIQTRSQSCKATIRFLHDVNCAALLDGPTLHPIADDPLNLPLPPAGKSKADQSESGETKTAENGQAQPHWLHSEGDVVSLPLPSHGVADVLVVFVDDANVALG